MLNKDFLVSILHLFWIRMTRTYTQVMCKGITVVALNILILGKICFAMMLPNI